MDLPAFSRRALPVLGLLSLGLLTGCIRTARGQQLYGGPQLPEERVARLVGPIERVDGNSVPAGVGTFELLPGCHLVQIGGSMGSFKSAPESGWSATVPREVYAFPMRAGRSYSITFEPEPALGMRSVGFGRIVAREDDGAGHHKVLRPAHTREDVNECVRLASGGAS
ncbi:MAG TPA: hypothetical protein VHB79_29840 [Polyangiaceae bacterium]|nr:hypothetical protein [Polyangiaceae bacterium]